jgi:sialate O-acetylesterase
MKRSINFQTAFLLMPCVMLVLAIIPVHAEPPSPKPFVSPLFGNHMVLQRNKPNRIWGWTEPGKVIRVKLGDQNAQTTSQADGFWGLSIQPPPAGGPYDMIISGPQKALFHDILVGDIWICSGQSNMEFGMSRVRDAEKEIKAAEHPDIRLYVVKTAAAYAPSEVTDGTWSLCSPQSVTRSGSSGFSGVGYYFGRKLQQDLQVPIGLIQAAVGGTPAETWTSAAGLADLTEFRSGLNEVRLLHDKGAPQYGNFISHWYDEYDIGQKEKWQDADGENWKSVTIPGGFKELGVPDAPAVCYFVKTIQLPDPVPAGGARLELGSVERMDTAFINGQWIGASAWVENPRVYKIGTGILKPGSNRITIRVLKTKPNGGFMSDPAKLKLVLGDDSEIPLVGEWKGRISVDAHPPHPLPAGYENWPTMPTVLFNGMISPLAPLSISGVIWYQGEANAGRATQYRTLLPAMISDWRKAFKQGDFPFYIASLASYMQHRDKAGDDNWAELREAQAFTAQSIANSGLAITIDKGDANDIHPIDKREVGERLALCALAKHYGKKISFSGPTLKSVEPIAGALKLHFDHLDGGLAIKGDKLEEFSITGDDGEWHWANARIEGETVVVSSPSVPHPRHVRYGWQSNPKATLYNQAGLPAVPFRSDSPCMKIPTK